MGCKLTAEEVAYIDRTIADLKAENAKLSEQIHWLKKGDILHVLTDQEFAEQQKHEREMQASIKALDDENAKLREEFDKMDVWHSKELSAAMAENAKLRELVRDMWRGCPVDERDCIACDFERDGMCDLFDRMRELGVEV